MRHVRDPARNTSPFALANAITATARDRTDVAVRLQLESLVEKRVDW